MPDGTQLAARCGCPTVHPVPVVMQYLPYRKRERHAGRRYSDRAVPCRARYRLCACRQSRVQRLQRRVLLDNRYTDDAQYVGGALALVNFEWGAAFADVLVGPPDPQVFGGTVARGMVKRLNAGTADNGGVARSPTLRRLLEGDTYLVVDRLYREHLMNSIRETAADLLISRSKADVFE